MVFTTKFDHGDTVHFYNDFMRPTSGKVVQILVESKKNKPVEVDYRIKVRGDGDHWHAECDLFACKVPKLKFD